MSITETKPELQFRCPAELYGVIPEPQPASQGLPRWFKDIPGETPNAFVPGTDDTVKRCPPFLDAMRSGFLIPLLCDVHVEKGEFTWDNELPAAPSLNYPRSPLGLHDPAQVSGTPLFDADRFPIKFHNLWAIEAPAGFSLLFTHPLNRFDLPFTTLTGLVDADRYNRIWIHFPAHWHDTEYCGVLPKGTPVAQCIPVRREKWSSTAKPFTDEEAQSAHQLLGEIAREKGVYRRRYRA